jgi:Tfp pilus assembly protein PilE
MKLNIKNRATSAFTVVELIIVVAVIAILATVTIVAYNGIQQNAHQAALISDLDNTAAIMAHDINANGAYAATVTMADGGKGLPTNSGTTYQYTVDNTVTPPTFCLTGTNGSAKYYINSNTDTPTKGTCPGDTNLATNGLGELGNNTNFTPLTFDASDFPVGSQGSFISPDGNYNFYTGSQSIPVDPTHKYVVRGWARQRTSGVTTSRWYLGLAPYDIDNKGIYPQNYMYRPGTTTTLAQPLHTGDTVVYLTNASSSWYDVSDTLTHLRSFIFWGYTDSTGKLWSPETYSQNAWYADIYNGGVGAINHTNNTITLNKPWPGVSYPAGQPVSNGGAGSTFMYSAASYQLLTSSWQEWISPTITGTTPGGLFDSSTTFPPATKSVRISIGLNAGSPPTTSRQAVGGIRFSDINQ